MAYGDFTLPRVLTDFGLTLRTDLDLFGHIPPVPTDLWLTMTKLPIIGAWAIATLGGLTPRD